MGIRRGNMREDLNVKAFFNTAICRNSVSALALAAGALAASSALAQEEGAKEAISAAPVDPSDIVVTGTRASLQSAIAR
jgi:hypothetical protein